MKRLLLTLITFAIVALPAVAHADAEPTNDPLPLRILLPVVTLAGCPYEVEHMYYSPDDAEDAPIPPTHNFIVDKPDLYFPPYDLSGQVRIAQDPDMQQVLFTLRMGWAEVPVLIARLERQQLNAGQYYYWQARIACAPELFGPWSPAQEFIAQCPECR